MALLAELAERDATGDHKAIYAEIRRLGGVPMVALIYRHLATLPGTLEWAWRAVGPSWQSGLVQEAAWGIARGLSVAPLVPIPRAALDALGIDGATRAGIDGVLAAYNRANPENLLTVMCLLRLLAGSAASVPLATRDWQPPSAPAPMLPMVDVASFTPEVAALLDLMAAPGDAGDPKVVQSLYRHFAQLPAFLALAVTLLLARRRDGAIAAAVAALQRAMSTAADQLVHAMDAPPVPHAGARPALARFGGGVIAEMIVVGTLLERALP